MPSSTDLGVEDVLDVVQNLYGIEGDQIGHEFKFLCPVHSDRDPSAGVNVVNGYWHCFSCGAGGDLAELGAKVLERDRDEVVDLLRPGTPEKLLEATKRKLARLAAPVVRRRRNLELPDYTDREPLDELRDRLFTDATLDKFEVRYVREQTLTGNRGDYTIRNSIAIPIRGRDGDLLAWCYRATAQSPSWQPRYLYTPGVEVSELWFGLPHHTQVSHVSIVEGALDGMWWDQCGFPALGLLGSQMGDRKIKWLQQYESVTLVPDRDAAGAKWMARVSDMIGRRMPLYVAQYRPWFLKKTPEVDGTYRRAKDPEEIRPVDVEIMMATRIPYLTWRLKRAG